MSGPGAGPPVGGGRGGAGQPARPAPFRRGRARGARPESEPVRRRDGGAPPGCTGAGGRGAVMGSSRRSCRGYRCGRPPVRSRPGRRCRRAVRARRSGTPTGPGPRRGGGRSAARWISGRSRRGASRACAGFAEPGRPRRRSVVVGVGSCGRRPSRRGCGQALLLVARSGPPFGGVAGRTGRGTASRAVAVGAPCGQGQVADEERTPSWAFFERSPRAGWRTRITSRRRTRVDRGATGAGRR